MPRAFLYKKKRKGGPKSIDVDELSYYPDSHHEETLFATLKTPDHFLKVPFYLQSTTENEECESSPRKPKSQSPFTFPTNAKEEDTKVNGGGDICVTLTDVSSISSYPSPGTNIFTKSELQKPFSEEKDGTKNEVFGSLNSEQKRSETEFPKLRDMYDIHDARPEPVFYSNGKTKLRECLESCRRKSDPNEESIYTISNPLHERSSRLFSKPNDSPDTSFAFLPLNGQGSQTRKSNYEDQKWNVSLPQKEKTMAFSKVGTTFDPNSLSSLYQSYLYSATYYNSLQLRAWRNLLPLGNSSKYKQTDSKDPFSGNGRALLGSHPRTLAGLFNFPVGSDTVGVAPPSATSFNYLSAPLGKTGARQPVPGVEYVKNKIDLEVSSTSGEIPVRDSRLAETSSGSSSPVNDFMTRSSPMRLDTLRLPGLDGSKSVNTVDHKMESAFGNTCAPTILATPTPQTYRGGRRSASGKPPQPRKYVCDVCGKAFSRSNTLVTHKRIHTGDKPFACELCGRAFRQPGNLTRHRLTHTTVKPYVCTQCGKLITRYRPLSKFTHHNDGCTSNVYILSFQAFNRASNLHTHMRTHTNYKPFICQFCGKGFHQKIDMKIHSYTHTGEKPHKCKKCGRGFKQLTHLTYHMRTHSEVKMYTCNYCGKGFNQKGNLQAHIYRHTGERPHQCDICNKGFTLASTLNTHRRTHAEKKPFACHHCGKDFYQKNALKSHLIASHPYVDGDSLL
ncbi:Histone-lysine N-methyltransferase PRDM9 [Holothuria leucospilota]|uniref:Histone-lysine N-methyltransferase PRDM9 n=1 Tax=Holothuria leucospilota TaxID=206669 RepID=A0A9Q0YHR2_HOLLE|nr:Histone-lysine N-methyltransferase PRDM9 [Holothuria leucospilota]